MIDALFLFAAISSPVRMRMEE